ncbi:TIGR03620 family F420-dependent LLM class oxidoreductase [Pseudonocardia lacus]|uniref:TIGR03620 family F420-dependent LLM class oxidoreductase n=1 Tax=Pseudonocardia lacus TaxID=2835865 RepID=UPI001BDBBD86|nr:TIGR03620 family F420-dependent LLM class oxidoreductase [Pseudonocardia lacus]
MAVEIGPVGIHTLSGVWESGGAEEAVAELDRLGFGALWLGAVSDLRLPARLLAATDRLVVATSIINVWATPAARLAADAHRLAAAHPGRFLLGLGSSHAPDVEALGRSYARPLQVLSRYLDDLDAAPGPVPADGRVLAALGPRAVALAGRRSAGAHTYLVTPEHTHSARALLGPGPLLVPEQAVVLESDPARARALARDGISYFLRLPNYLRNLRALGFGAEDLAGGGSDRMVDALVAWGTPEQVAQRVAQHHDAGADHVAVQVLTTDGERPALPQWRALAPLLVRSGTG